MFGLTRHSMCWALLGIVWLGAYPGPPVSGEASAAGEAGAESGAGQVEVDETDSTELRSEDFFVRNDFCAEPRFVEISMEGSFGATVVADSTTIECTSSENSRCLGLEKVTAEGFVVKCWLENHGNCGPLGLWKDSPGSCSGSVQWREESTAG